jgi:hypothetical protein
MKQFYKGHHVLVSDDTRTYYEAVYVRPWRSSVYFYGAITTRTSNITGWKYCELDPDFETENNLITKQNQPMKEYKVDDILTIGKYKVKVCSSFLALCEEEDQKTKSNVVVYTQFEVTRQELMNAVGLVINKIGAFPPMTLGQLNKAIYFLKSKEQSQPMNKTTYKISEDDVAQYIHLACHESRVNILRKPVIGGVIDFTQGEVNVMRSAASTVEQTFVLDELFPIEKTYSIGQRFSIDGNEYLLSSTGRGNNEVIFIKLTGLDSGLSLRLPLRVKYVRKITISEMNDILNHLNWKLIK